jgi:hypothetical protein
LIVPDWLTLDFVAQIAAIGTAAVAVVGYAIYALERREQRTRLEQYLKAERGKNIDAGQRSLLHLVAAVGLSETELLQSSFRSRHIDRLNASDPETGRAGAILLVYVD